MMDHVLSLSYGKDSLACLGAIKALGWPLDRIVHADVWATDAIPADLPEMVDFKRRADRIIKDRWGIEVDHVRSDRTFSDYFYRRRASGAHSGEIQGWPMTRGPWCNDRLKTSVLDRAKRGCITYVGIAADEPARLARLPDTIRAPLAAVGWSESYCLAWCRAHDLLSPVYEAGSRAGCWFCPQQPVQQLRQLRVMHPDLWSQMLRWDTDSPVTFDAHGKSLHDFERRFALEDIHALQPGDPCFAWSQLDGHLQLFF